MFSFRFLTCVDFLASQHFLQLCGPWKKDALEIILTLIMPKLPLQVARRQVAASPASCLLPSQNTEAIYEVEESDEESEIPTIHTLCNFKFIICLSLVGYFDLTLVIKSVPKKRV